jgi:hypothetical protein
MTSRILVLVLTVFSFFTAYSEGIEAGLPPHYNVISDSLVSNIEEGKCIVKGKVFSGEDGVSNGRISNLAGTHSSNTNKDGEYVLMLNSSDTAIYFFADGYDEVVVWNYDFKSQHLVEINFYTAPNFIMDVEEKPVIYLYSEKEQAVEISLDLKGEMTYAYPKYNDSWSVVVEGDKLEVGGQSYPYLFWEGEQQNMRFALNEEGKIPGELLKAEEVQNYLETNLENFGFNATEKADFITYWAPRMLKYEQLFVQFLIDEEYDELIGAVKTVPEVDQKRRVYVLFADAKYLHQNKIAPPNYHVKAVDRSGLVYIEWGGTELSSKTFLSF